MNLNSFKSLSNQALKRNKIWKLQVTECQIRSEVTTNRTQNT